MKTSRAHLRYPWWLVLVFFGGCTRSGPEVGAPSRSEVWAAIQPQAQRYQLSAGFLYALVAAESNFNPKAQNGEARGLLQIKPAAWRTVSQLPYDTAVWDWRLNLEVGIDYLAYSRAYLHQRKIFSYPLLLASFHYGLDYVEQRNFKIREIPIPPNDIYRKLWAGSLEPVKAP